MEGKDKHMKEEKMRKIKRKKQWRWKKWRGGTHKTDLIDINNKFNVDTHDNVGNDINYNNRVPKLATVEVHKIINTFSKFLPTDSFDER